MPLSNSVLRRYTPPTCTLEIAAKTSALSRFVGKSVLKNLRFELRFDDPRQPDDKRVTIRGDAGELDMLYEAVNSYVQNFLESSPTQLPLTSGTSTTATGSTPHEYPSWDSLASPPSGVTHPDAIATPSFNHESGKFDDSTSVSPQEFNSKVRSLNGRSLATDIYLEPKGLLAHNLVLGHLATEESGAVVNLSATQLFDLVSALDEYVSESVALPKQNALSGKKAPPAWAYTAAAVVVAVGATATTMNILNRSQTPQTALTQAPTNQQPSPTAPPSPGATPLPTASVALLPTPTVPSPLSTAPRVLPPSPVQIPTVPSPLNVPLGNQRTTDTSLDNQRPTATIRINPTEPETPKSQRSSPSVAQGGIASSRPPSSSEIASSRPPSSSGIASSRSPSPSPTATSPTVTLSGGRRNASSPPPEKAPPAEKAPPETAPTRTNKPTDVATAPPLPDLPSLKPSTTTASNPITTGNLSSSSLPTSAPPADLNQSASAEAGDSGNSRLFDTIPQVAQVRNYFQQRWKPPSGLTQDLQYILVLNTDGSIQRFIALGTTADTYKDKVGIPVPGTPIASGGEGNDNPIIRLVLHPEGHVETFQCQTISCQR